MAIQPPWEENKLKDIGISKRKPWMAVVLSIIQLGIGHVYVGSPFRGFSFLIFFYVIIFSAGALQLLVTPLGMFATTGALLVLIIAGIVDAASLARKRNNYNRKSYNHWVVYLILTTLLWGVWEVVTTNKEEMLGYGAYRISSSSMLPTLTPNDYFITDSRAYQSSNPKAGDVVVFVYPKDKSKKFVGRISAVENDVIEIKKGALYLNHKKVLNDYSKNSTALSDYSAHLDAVKVPQQSVFILGDNLENSRDSRVYGSIPYDAIVGKVRYIWFSDKIDRIGMEIP